MRKCLYGLACFIISSTQMFVLDIFSVFSWKIETEKGLYI